MTESSRLVPSSTHRPWRALLVLLLVGAAAWALWVYGPRLMDERRRLAAMSETVGVLQGQQLRLEQRIADLAEAARQNSGETATLATRLDEQSAISARLTEQLQGGYSRMQMTVVEHLLLSANERAQIQNDRNGALAALELADQRLGRLSDPRLLNVRRAIADERAALQALPALDSTAAALTFSSVIARVPTLPLRAEVPKAFDPKVQNVDVPVDATRTQRAWASIQEAMSAVFSIRRHSGAPPRLLPADAEAVVYHVLLLKLEGARLALLRNDAVSYRDLCRGASRWMGDYFRADDPGVMAAQAELERLLALQPVSTLPDLSRSLTLLRSAMEGPAR